MATRMTSRDCEGQSELINGIMSRDGKRKTIYGSNHKFSFLSLLFLLCQKQILWFCFVLFFTRVELVFFVYHGLTVYASL